NPGDQVNLYYPNLSSNTRLERITVNGQAVPYYSSYAARPYGTAAPAPGLSARNSAGVQQQQMNFETDILFRLPENIDGDSAKLAFLLREGAASKKISQAIPLAPTRLAVDFFPEGGELVEGVPNRVYYRVRSAWGEPVAQEGHLTLACRTDEVASTFALG